jgi:hypothetical protein
VLCIHVSTSACNGASRHFLFPPMIYECSSPHRHVRNTMLTATWWIGERDRKTLIAREHNSIFGSGMPAFGCPLTSRQEDTFCQGQRALSLSLVARIWQPSLIYILHFVSYRTFLCMASGIWTGLPLGYTAVGDRSVRCNRGVYVAAGKI